MRIETFDVLAALRRTRLRDGQPIYADAELELTPAVDPESLAPAQRYVLRSGVARVLALRDALLPHGIDVFALAGGVRADGIPVIPPVVEADASGALLIADGMHRVYAARSLRLPITVVAVRGVPPELPYYAFPLEDGWDGVAVRDTVPPEAEKKRHRRPEDHRALYRDYDAVIPGVQPPAR